MAHQLAFTWVSPLMSLGSRRQLQHDDLLELPPELQPTECRRVLWAKWKQVTTRHGCWLVIRHVWFLACWYSWSRQCAVMSCGLCGGSCNIPFLLILLRHHDSWGSMFLTVPFLPRSIRMQNRDGRESFCMCNVGRGSCAVRMVKRNSLSHASLPSSCPCPRPPMYALYA